MKALVFGGSGMLGRYVLAACHARGWGVEAPVHAVCDVANPVDVLRFMFAAEADVILNCAGSIPSRVGHELPGSMVAVNGSAPHFMETAAQRLRTRFVHVSTDCVYDGTPPGDAEGPLPRTVTAPAAPLDLYGRSKLAGEPQGLGDHVTVRTSFIGPVHGLWPWAQSMAGQQVEGWEHAYWSGSTVDAVADALLDIADDRTIKGVQHLATPEPMSKASVLMALSVALAFDLHIEVTPEPHIDRSMRPTVELPPLHVALAGARTVAP